jgi:hypothetical protein
MFQICFGAFKRSIGAGLKKMGTVREGGYAYPVKCWGYGYVTARLCLEGRGDNACEGRYAGERTIR